MTRALRLHALSVLLAVPVVACSSSKKDEATIVQAEPQSLYQRLGGVDTLRKLVDEWMLEIASDQRIRDFFVDADIPRLKLRLVERICVLVDGPCMYRGRDIYEAHASLDLEERHLRAFLEGLEPAMQRANIKEGPGEELREAIHGLAAELALAKGL